MLSGQCERDSAQPMPNYSLSRKPCDEFRCSELIGIEENTIGDADDSGSAPESEDRWVGYPAEVEAHRRWHEENDEYLPLLRQQREMEQRIFGLVDYAPQPASSSNDVATQTDFVPVLEPLRRLRGQSATASTHPEVYAFLEEADLA